MQHWLKPQVHDNFWASGLLPGLTEVSKPSSWPGQNKLGILLLMNLRKEINVEANEEKSNDKQSNTNECNTFKSPPTQTRKPYTPKTIVHSNKNQQKSTGSIQEYFTPIEGTPYKTSLRLSSGLTYS